MEVLVCVLEVALLVEELVFTLDEVEVADVDVIELVEVAQALTTP